MTRPRLQISLLWLCSLLIPSFSSPLTSYNSNITDDLGIVPSPLSDQRAHGSGIMVSWLWGLVWGDDSTVTVVDRTPVIDFDSRPAAFGPVIDVLGYMIRVEDFSVPCEGDKDGNETQHKEPWWPGGREEWDAENTARWRTKDPERWAREARYGCPHLCMRDKQPEASATWIALVMRGQCTFVDKVREAQRLGAKGVVVGGETEAQDNHGDGLVQMFSLGDSSDITIPSTYITHDSYDTLSSLIASSNTSTWGLRTVSVAITTDPSGWEWYSPLLTFLILLFLPSSLTLCTLLVHRIRSARAARRERAPENIVLNLPWRVWEGQETLWELEKSLDNVKPVSEQETNRKASPMSVSEPEPVLEPTGIEPIASETAARRCEPSTSHSHDTHVPLSDVARKWYEMQGECAICLEDFVKGDKVRVLPCRHIFHMDEVDDWLIRRKKLCPICKHDVTRPPYPPPGSDSVTQQTIPMQGDQSSGPLSTVYEDDTEPDERTPLLQRPVSGDAT